jgi:hypothetical protein
MSTVRTKGITDFDEKQFFVSCVLYTTFDRISIGMKNRGQIYKSGSY